jgi:uncharacterized phiE125 gp8 family phage protein
MSYVQTAAPTASPVAVADAATHCRVTDPADFAYLQGLIDAATAWIEDRLQRQLITATWKLYLDGFPDEIRIERLPVAGVASIKYLDSGGTLTTLAPALYSADYATKDTPARIMPAAGACWPEVYPYGYSQVTVEFTAGYGATWAYVPAGIRHALMMLIAWWFEQREPVNIGNIVNNVPLAVESLMGLASWGHYA